MKEKKEKKVKIRKKMSSKAKKVLILSTFCALLLITGGVNIYLNNVASTEANATIQTSANFFSNYRDDRTDTRNQEILYLDAIIASEATSAEAKANAEAERLNLVTSMDMVMTIENLIKAKGFDDVVVSTSSGNISVIVETAGLTNNEVAQIVDVVKNNSNYSIDNIKIIEV
ncbi:MAG: SpoIIIAH-like family protein [Clostridiales bacterium]|nr:SpoIIIAH-like family protein [Clostridiales bacterium]